MSAIVPVYNCRRYLAEALHSALRQQGAELEVEVVIVDDGSTDGTFELAKQLASSDPTRIRVFHQRRRGPAAARNRGAAKARGDWLAFLDGDDVWLPGKLSRQLRCVGPDVGLIYTDRSTFGAGMPERRLSQDVALQRGDVFEALIRNNFITASSVLLRRDAFQELGGFCEYIYGAEDWDLWLRYAHDRPVELCPEPLTRYRRHAAGVSSDPCSLFLAQCKVLARALALPRGRDVDRAALRFALAGDPDGALPGEPRAREYVARLILRCGTSTRAVLERSARQLVAGLRSAAASELHEPEASLDLGAAAVELRASSVPVVLPPSRRTVAPRTSGRRS